MKRRRSFLSTFIFTIFFWLVWLLVLFFTAPESYFLLTAFYFLLFLALALTFSLLLANSRRGFLIALGIVLFLIFRWQKLGNILNTFLLMATISVLEIYLTKRK